MDPVDVDVLCALLTRHAPPRAVPLVPTLRAFHADDELPLWQAAEEAFGRQLPAPFWAVAWPGAQALARVVLDGTLDVRGRVVVDVGCGSGLAAAAAARAGAASVVAVDVDPLAAATATLTARENGVLVEPRVGDPILGSDDLVAAGAVVLAGDVVYNRDVGNALRARIAEWRDRGAQVVLADSGRPFFHAAGTPERACFDVDVPVAVEGARRRTVRLYW